MRIRSCPCRRRIRLLDTRSDFKGLTRSDQSDALRQPWTNEVRRSRGALGVPWSEAESTHYTLFSVLQSNHRHECCTTVPYYSITCSSLWQLILLRPKAVMLMQKLPCGLLVVLSRTAYLGIAVGRQNSAVSTRLCGGAGSEGLTVMPNTAGIPERTIGSAGEARNQPVRQWPCRQKLSSYHFSDAFPFASRPDPLSLPI